MSFSSRRRAHFHTFTRSSLFALQSWKSPKIVSKMELQIGPNAAKTPSKIGLCFTNLLTRCLIKNEPQNGSQNDTGAVLFESFFTCGPKPRPWRHFGPLLGHFWSPQGSMLAAFGSLLLSPKLQFWYPRPMF